MLTVNLFDDTFRHDVGSIAWQPPTRVRYVRSQLDFAGPTLFTDGNLFGKAVDEVQAPRKIGWLHEPLCLIPDVYARANDSAVVRKFEFILTYDPDLLTVPGFRFAPYGGVWIDRSRWGVHSKTANVSMLVGAKRATTGHCIRHTAAAALPASKFDLFGVYGRPVNYSRATKELVTRDYRFQIVSETCWLPNLFTEITLDNFAMGTVPVLWGCPNLADFGFDPAGVIWWNDVAELVDLVRDLTPERYASMLPAIRRNLAAVSQWALTDDWIAQKHLEG